MKTLKEGTAVKVTRGYIRWHSENSDSMFGYPNAIRPRSKQLVEMLGEESILDQLSEYFMWRYSFERNLGINGVIIANNGKTDSEFAYLVWAMNELGESVQYISPENLVLF